MLSNSLVKVLQSPRLDDLWSLRGDILEAGISLDGELGSVLKAFAGFLDSMATGTSSRDYSEMASLMDISAITGVVAEHLLEPGTSKEMAIRLFSALATEGLMALATRQHVKAWEGELASVCRGVAWNLYEFMWCWALKRRPELGAVERRQLLDQLLDPLLSSETPCKVKAVIIGRLFQVLLLSYLSDAVENSVKANKHA